MKEGWTTVFGTIGGVCILVSFALIVRWLARENRTRTISRVELESVDRDGRR